MKTSIFALCYILYAPSYSNSPPIVTTDALGDRETPLVEERSWSWAVKFSEGSGKESLMIATKKLIRDRLSDNVKLLERDAKSSGVAKAREKRGQ